MKAITIRVDQVDASRSYTVQILTSPSGVPVVVGSLTLPISTIGVTTTAVSAAIAADAELGARIVRATGSGKSDFNAIVVNVVLVQ